MKIKSVIELSDFEAAAISGTLATLNEIIEYTEKRKAPELNTVKTTAEKAMSALKDFYEKCYLES